MEPKQVEDLAYQHATQHGAILWQGASSRNEMAAYVAGFNKAVELLKGEVLTTAEQLSLDNTPLF